MTIVVVEDDPATALLLAGALEPLQRPVASFADPLTALRHLANNGASLIVTDYLMPNLDGADLVRRIRALPRHGDVPVLMITVAEDRGLLMRAFDAGVTDFVNKPIDPLEMLARSRALLRLADAQLLLRGRAERLAGEVAEAAATLEIKELERQELLHQLLAAERFRAVAQLSSGMAHDFNNLLSVVAAAAFALEQSFPDEPIVTEATQPMRAAVERGAALIQQMLAYSRRQTLHAAVFDMGAELAEMRLVLARTAGDAMRLDLQLAPVKLPLLADRAQFLTAVINLVANARDASGGTGQIVVRTALQAAATAGAPDHAVLEVADQGIGMDAATAARAFEPFFTTRARVGGTGLGLSMVHGFVHQSGGRVTLDSTPGRGTVLRLAFPVLTEQAPAPEASVPPLPAMSTGGLDLLLVDDNTVLAAMLAKTLTAEGLQVSLAANADDAVSLLECQIFSAVVTDVVMSGEMDGIDLGRWVRRHRPGMAVVIVSGYGGTGLPEDLAADPAVRFLPKPLDGAVLLQALRELAAICRDIASPA
jgi:signal transduction histidine kinase